MRPSTPASTDPPSPQPPNASNATAGTTNQRRTDARRQHASGAHRSGVAHHAVHRPHPHARPGEVRPSPQARQTGHNYTYTCALCRNDTEALTDALLTVFTDELKADWSRYRSRILQEAWEALRDADDGPLIDGMHVINDLLEKK